jgi:hypothetical protein
LESLKEGEANAENLRDIMGGGGGDKTFKSPRAKSPTTPKDKKGLKPMKSILFEHSDEEDD